MKKQCATCGKKITRAEIGAGANGPGYDLYWCLPCWDDDDSSALIQYQLAGLGISVQYFPEGEEDGP